MGWGRAERKADVVGATPLGSSSSMGGGERPDLVCRYVMDSGVCVNISVPSLFAPFKAE